MDAKYAKYHLNHRLLLKDGFFTYYLQSNFLSCDDILDVQTLVFDWPEDTEQWLLQCADHDYFETFYNLRDFLAEEEIDFGLHLMDDSRVLLAAARCITDARAPIVIQPDYGWTVKTDPGTGATTIPIAVEAAHDPEGLINELRHELDALVAEQWKKYNAYERRLSENNDFIEYSKAVGGGLYDFTAGTVSSTIDTIKAASTVIRALDDLAASFKHAAAISLLHGTLNPLKKEIDAIVKPLADTYEQALEYKAILTTLFNDEETAELLTDFAKRYYKATHPLELTKMGVSGSGDIILTIILIIFTAGVGAAANAAIKVKRLEKIASILSKLAKIFRRIGPRHRLPKLNKKGCASAKNTAKLAAKKKKGIPGLDSPKKKGDLVDGDRKKRYGDQTGVDSQKKTTRVAELSDIKTKGLRAKRVLSGSNDKVAVIGRTMGNDKLPGVRDYFNALRSKGYDVEIFDGKNISDAAKREFAQLTAGGRRLSNQELMQTKMFSENKAWAKKLVDEGYTVVDLGNPYPKNQGFSPFYAMEKKFIFSGGPK